jgi:Meiotically up-regulated gene 113
MRFWLSGHRIFGVRLSVSIEHEDFRRKDKGRQSVSAKAPDAKAPEFVYVIKGDQGFRKIGISSNPNAWLAQLRRASPFPLQFEFVAMVSGNAAAIEKTAHEMLANHRQAGEWFACEGDMAATAIRTAAFRLNQQITTVTPEQIDLASAAARYGALRFDVGNDRCDVFGAGGALGVRAVLPAAIAAGSSLTTLPSSR